MDRYTVLPRDDGQDFRNSWMVHKNNQMKSNHTTKQAAENAARNYASDGDTLEIRRTNGTVQKRVTVQKASASSDSENEQQGMSYSPSIPGAGEPVDPDIPVGEKLEFDIPLGPTNHGEGVLEAANPFTESED